MSPASSREKKLEALLDATQILNSSQNTSQILKALLELSLDLIDGGDTGCIFLYNNSLDLLEMFAYVGMGDAVSNVKMAPGESMTGLAFVKKEAIFFPDRQAVKEHMNNLSSNNIELTLAGNVDPSNIYGSICCPLIYKDKALGVLVIDNFKNNAPLLEDDVELLKAISVQATIAVINAKNLENELQNNQKLEKYNKIIENQRNMYKYSTQIHGKFTNMVLKGSSFDDILNEIKSLSGKNVFLVDLFYNISNHTFDKRVPPNYYDLKSLMIAKLKKYKKSTFFDPTLDMHFFTFPIMVKQEIMGWLCLVSPTVPLAENDVIIAERSATILAIEMLKQNELIDLEQSLKGDFLDNLLTGDNEVYLEKYSANYKFNISSPHRILIIRFVFNHSNNEDKQKEKHIWDCLKHYYSPFNAELRTHFPGSIALIRHHSIVCILDSSSSKDNCDVEKVLDIVRTKYQQNYSHEFKAIKLRIGISDSFGKIRDFRNAYESAKQTVRMIENSTAPIESLYFKDIEVKRFLLANDKKDLLSYFQKVLSPLLNYQHNSREDFLETLDVYLKSNCNWSESKKRLHIHGNTLTYRLNRISDLLNLDLKNYQDRLRLQIAFEIKDLLK